MGKVEMKLLEKLLIKDHEDLSVEVKSAYFLLMKPCLVLRMTADADQWRSSSL